jgi:hypothetical protein
MRASSTSKIIIPTTRNEPRKQKFIDGGLGKMMDYAIISTEQVQWSSTSSGDDQTGCVPEIRREKESQSIVHGLIVLC